MGSADAIPGVSGGTIALITEIYEELINSIKSIDEHALLLLSKFQISKLWKHINGNFLIWVLMGIVISLLTLARVFTYLIINHPVQLWSFFFGLIVISAIIVLRRIKKWNLLDAIAVIFGTLIAYIITELTPAETPEAWWFIFFSGVIAICAMILPGISGAFILLLLGKYEYILGALKDFQFDVILIFIVGCIVGLLSFVRLISLILNRYHDMAIALLSGFMIGSLNKIWPWKIYTYFRIDSHGDQKPINFQNLLPGEYYEITGQDPQLLQAILFMAIGFLLVLAIEFIAAPNK